MSETQNVDVAQLLKAVGHPVRFQIVNEIARRQASCCGEVCKCFSLSQSTISQHLSILHQAGVLEFERRGNRSHYCLNLEAIHALQKAIGALLQPSGEARG